MCACARLCDIAGKANELCVFEEGMRDCRMAKASATRAADVSSRRTEEQALYDVTEGGGTQSGRKGNKRNRWI